MNDGWRKGPLPPDTWHWGGVVPVGSDPKDGFYFADFRGDHAMIINGDAGWERVEAFDVAYFNNCLCMPV